MLFTIIRALWNDIVFPLCPLSFCLTLLFFPVQGRRGYLQILVVPYIPTKQQIQSLTNSFRFRIVQWKSIKVFIWLVLKVVKYIDWELNAISFIYQQIEHFVFVLNWLIPFWFSYHYVLFQCQQYNHSHLKVLEYSKV